MRQRTRWIVGAALTWVVAAPAGAQEPGDTASLREMIVTANRVPLAPELVSSAVTVLRGEDLRARGVRYVADALREVPGATVVPTGSYGGVTSVFLRGGESDYVKVLVDGVPVNQPGGSFDFAHLTTDDLERIEVVRGPVSVLYGSDAVAGVVQIFTRRGGGPLATELEAGGGSFGTLSGRAQLTGGTEDIRFAVGLALLDTDGTYRFNSGYRNASARAMVQGRLDDRTDATLMFRYRDHTAHFPTDFAGVPSDANQLTYEESIALSLDLARRLGGRAEARLLLAAHAVDGGFDDRPDGPADTVGFGFAATRSASTMRRSADLRLNLFAAPGHVLTAGVEVSQDQERRQGLSSSNFGSGPETTPDSPFDESRRNVGLYVQAVLAAGHQASVDLGARLDENQRFGTFVTLRAGGTMRPAAHTRLRASVGTAFKAPTFPEHFAATPFEIGDPALDPERSFAWEVGAEQGFAGGRVAVVLDYFDQRFRDLIQYRFLDATSPTYVNLARARARGIEAGARATPVPGVSVGAAYTWLDTEVTDAGVSTEPGDAFVTGERLLRRPTHQGRVFGSVRIAGRATVGGAMTRIGSRSDVDFRLFPSERVELPAATLLDFHASLDLLGSAAASALRLHLRVENALDSQNDTVVGFPARGRSIQAGAAVRF